MTNRRKCATIFFVKIRKGLFVMELKKDIWTKRDIKPFLDYLRTFSKGEEKAKWEQRIVATALPCIAVPSPTVKKISSELAKGNFISFIDLWIWDNFTCTSIIGSLIPKVKDLDKQKEYLYKFSQKADCWATTDCIKLKIKEKDENFYISLASDYIVNTHTYTRRLGLIILLKMVNDRTVESIFDIAIKLKNEKEYYVNMALAWLLAECFAKQREKTLAFFEKREMQKFVINKTISKCRDSYRVSPEDKEMLLKYRIK